ncbi:circumsporozoite protein-like [Paramacrobiotus metropolitanus]|uniref:circumsporozoite protein-like n=1 Tax=Paramacrobiotus metropolitanus TaxID=2943436 RepID=UPI002445CCC6|nr:circumsporozoite protein-like [Paramacrobiotus metropolitanus]
MYRNTAFFAALLFVLLNAVVTRGHLKHHEGNLSLADAAHATSSNTTHYDSGNHARRARRIMVIDILDHGRQKGFVEDPNRHHWIPNVKPNVENDVKSTVKPNAIPNKKPNGKTTVKPNAIPNKKTTEKPNANHPHVKPTVNPNAYPPHAKPTVKPNANPHKKPNAKPHANPNWI